MGNNKSIESKLVNYDRLSKIRSQQNKYTKVEEEIKV